MAWWRTTQPPLPLQKPPKSGVVAVVADVEANVVAEAALLRLHLLCRRTKLQRLLLYLSLLLQLPHRRRSTLHAARAVPLRQAQWRRAR
jgi:hypothetical protein